MTRQSYISTTTLSDVTVLREICVVLCVVVRDHWTELHRHDCAILREFLLFLLVCVLL